MARITKQQEFDELSKFGCAFLQTNNYGGYSIVIDDGGEFVLWRDCTSRNEHTARRWQRKNTLARVILKLNHARTSQYRVRAIIWTILCAALKSIIRGGSSLPIIDNI